MLVLSSEAVVSSGITGFGSICNLPNIQLMKELCFATSLWSASQIIESM